jgi:hypothetical protein
MVKVFVEVVSGNLNALSEVWIRLELQELQNLFQGFGGFILSKASNEFSWIIDQLQSLLRNVFEDGIESYEFSPLNTMLNQVWEQFDCANLIISLLLVLRVAIAQRLVRHNHL